MVSLLGFETEHTSVNQIYWQLQYYAEQHVSLSCLPDKVAAVLKQMSSPPQEQTSDVWLRCAGDMRAERWNGEIPDPTASTRACVITRDQGSNQLAFVHVPLCAGYIKPL